MPIELDALQKQVDKQLADFVSLMSNFRRTGNMSFWRLAYMHMDHADTLQLRIHQLDPSISPIVQYPVGWDAEPLGEWDAPAAPVNDRPTSLFWGPVFAAVVAAAMCCYVVLLIAVWWFQY